MLKNGKNTVVLFSCCVLGVLIGVAIDHFVYVESNPDLIVDDQATSGHEADSIIDSSVPHWTIDDPDRPAISCDHDLIDFGIVKPSGQLQRDFYITNSGLSPLHIVEVVSSCGCTLAEPEEKILMPGGSTMIKLEVTPTFKPGVHNMSVAIRSNDPANSVLTLEIRIEVSEAT